MKEYKDSDPVQKEYREKVKFERAYLQLTLRDQNNLTDCVMDLARRAGLSHEDAFYLLGKLAIYLAKNNNNGI